MKYKIIIPIIIIITLIIIGLITINNNKEITIEGEILAIGSNYLLISTSNKEEYLIHTKNINYTIGDILKLNIKKINKTNSPYKATATNIEIIKKKENNPKTEENDETTPDIVPEIENNKDSNIIEESKTWKESDIVNYFKNLDNEVSSSKNITKNIKDKFIQCIDFIFYDGKIGEKTFKELTNETKLKILEITLSIDSKIDSKLPGYKDTINEKYQNIKNKIIEKYLEITTNICQNNQEACINAKEGFNNIKEKFEITWDFIKEVAKKGTSKLKDWYEIWKYN